VSFPDDEVGPAMMPHGSSSAVAVAELRHERIRDQLSDYMDGSLADANRAQVDDHLVRCSLCRAYLDTMEATRQAVSRLPRPRAPQTAKKRLQQIPEREST
jgi:anti-sigma factor RsiW